MKAIRHLAWALLLAAVSALAAPPEQPRAPGIESDGYQWEDQPRELVDALARRGDPKLGREAYEFCQGCHRADGAGRADGSYPQLAGQHASVLIKQMIDIRLGRRDNPIMYPFAGEHVIEADEVADIAAYLESLPVSSNNGKGPGDALAHGRTLYAQDCLSCHGERGEGDAERFYPLLAGQHYAYLLRQTREIKHGERRNANRKMVRVLQHYSDADMQAVVDHMSRLQPPKR